MLSKPLTSGTPLVVRHLGWHACCSTATWEPIYLSLQGIRWNSAGGLRRSRHFQRTVQGQPRCQCFSLFRRAACFLPLVTGPRSASFCLQLQGCRSIPGPWMHICKGKGICSPSLPPLSSPFPMLQMESQGAQLHSSQEKQNLLHIQVAYILPLGHVTKLLWVPPFTGYCV